MTSVDPIRSSTVTSDNTASEFDATLPQNQGEPTSSISFTKDNNNNDRPERSTMTAYQNDNGTFKLVTDWAGDTGANGREVYDVTPHEDGWDYNLSLDTMQSPPDADGTVSVTMRQNEFSYGINKPDIYFTQSMRIDSDEHFDLLTVKIDGKTGQMLELNVEFGNEATDAADGLVGTSMRNFLKDDTHASFTADLSNLDLKGDTPPTIDLKQFVDAFDETKSGTKRD